MGREKGVRSLAHLQLVLHPWATLASSGLQASSVKQGRGAKSERSQTTSAWSGFVSWPVTASESVFAGRMEEATLVITNNLGLPAERLALRPRPTSTPAYLAPKRSLSQRGAARRGQFGDGAPRGSAVGLEQMGSIFGKLQDVAGVCWLGVNGQDRACGVRGTGEGGKRRDEGPASLAAT